MVWSYEWTTDFTQPAVLTGLAMTSDTDVISLDGIADASADTYHYEYLWEAQYGDRDWEEIGRTTDPSITYYLAPENVDVRIRVSDSNGSQYSDPMEVTGRLDFGHWALTHVDGDGDFIQPIKNDLPTTTTDLPIDQNSVQPLSGPDGDTQYPIFFTGQYQGERIAINFYMQPEDVVILGVLKRAALQPAGKIALKSPDGDVYLVQLVGGIRISDMGNGNKQVAVTATRVG